MRASGELRQVASADALGQNPSIALVDNDPVLILPHVLARSRRLNRALDIVVAVMGLMLSAPLMLCIAVAVRVTSKGPAIFRQMRPGRDGELFEVLKFRTMADGTHLQVADDWHLRDIYESNDFKLPSDHSSITRIGRVLRRTSLDELPQLVNILRGEMSVVGVRPLLPDQLARRSSYDRSLYGLHRPGLTGLWQIEGRSEIEGEDRIKLDRTYLENWSVASNLRILARTPAAVVRGDGAH